MGLVNTSWFPTAAHAGALATGDYPANGGIFLQSATTTPEVNQSSSWGGGQIRVVVGGGLQMPGGEDERDAWQLQDETGNPAAQTLIERSGAGVHGIGTKRDIAIALRKNTGHYSGAYWRGQSAGSAGSGIGSNGVAGAMALLNPLAAMLVYAPTLALAEPVSSAECLVAAMVQVQAAGDIHTLYQVLGDAVDGCDDLAKLIKQAEQQDLCASRTVGVAAGLGTAVGYGVAAIITWLIARGCYRSKCHCRCRVRSSDYDFTEEGPNVLHQTIATESQGFNEHDFEPSTAPGIQQFGEPLLPANQDEAP
jgi:hypothetical protein